MRAQSFILNQAKLHPPPLPRDLVPRPRLRARLARCLEHRLILVSASAGLGKTTLLAECAADSPHPVAWLSLDKQESDQSAFVSYLLAAIQTVYPNACSNLFDMLSAPRLPSPHHFATALINEIAGLPGDLVLVLDDYQVIQDDAVHHLLAALIRHLPPQLHLVIATRQDPPLPLSDLRVSQQMIELGADDLRFTLDETLAFLEQAVGSTLDREVAVELEQRTEGWIAGLRLAALSLRHAADPAAFAASFAGSSRRVRDYLLDEVLASHPSSVQAFLLCTSILDRFCAPLCSAVLADGQMAGHEGPRSSSPSRPSPGQILEAAAHANFFLVPLDKEGKWYRYHRLLRQALRARLEADHSQAEIAALHTRASAWLAEHGLIDEALHHAQAGGDVMAAVRLVESSVQDIADSRSWPTLDRWLRMLPYDVIQHRPILLLAEARTLYRESNFDAALPFLDKASALLDAGAVADELTERILRAKIDAFRSQHYFMQGEAQLCLESARRALDCLPARYSDARSFAICYTGQAHLIMGQAKEAERFLTGVLSTEARNNSYLASQVLLTLCAVHLKSANLVGLEQVGRHYLELAQKNGSLDGMGWAHHWLGAVKYEWNELDVAARHFSQVLQVRRAAHSMAVHNSMLWLALIYQAQGKPAEADQMVEECLGFALEISNIRYQAEAEAFRARLSLVRGDVEPAAGWLQWATLPDLSPVPRTSAGTLSKIQTWALIARGTPDSLQESSKLLDRALERARTQHNTQQIIKVLALQALAHRAGAQEEQALSTLEEAVTLGWPGNFIRTFVDLGPAMGDLLAQLARRGVAPEYLGRVLAAFPEPAPGERPAAIRRPATARSEPAVALNPPSPSPGLTLGPAKDRAAGSTRPLVLIVEDDEELADLLGEMLGDRGYRLLFSGDGVEGLQMVQSRDPDLVVLDVLMPRMDGWETCRRIRQISNVPIILLTCRTDEADKVRGLNLGADDYLTKPVSKGEFVARVRALLRRSGRPDLTGALLQVDDRLAVDRAQASVLVDGQAVDLSATEYKLLLCLLENAGRICTRQSLLTQVWGWEYVDEPNYLKVYVHHLRHKIEDDPSTPRYILTERGLGYRFQAPHDLNPF